MTRAGDRGAPGTRVGPSGEPPDREACRFRAGTEGWENSSILLISNDLAGRGGNRAERSRQFFPLLRKARPGAITVFADACEGVRCSGLLALGDGSGMTDAVAHGVSRFQRS